jgi:hypothetical protein
LGFERRRDGEHVAAAEVQQVVADVALVEAQVKVAVLEDRPTLVDAPRAR